MYRTTLTLRTVPLLIAAAYAGSAIAQESNALDEVIVISQKRPERLRDVPISITAIGGSQLEARGIEGSRDLSSLAPSLMVTSGNSGSYSTSVYSIRGNASGSPGFTQDTTVGVYIDGVYTGGKNGGGLFDVLDLERVEVLRGPQGTLFGRNTLAGAINFITRKPLGVFSGAVGLEMGSYGAKVERVSLDLPRMSGLNVGVAYRKEARDGWGKNLTGPADKGKVDKQSYRLTATLDVTSDLQAYYSYDHSTQSNTPRPLSIAPSGFQGKSTVPAILSASSGFPSTVSTNPGFVESDNLSGGNHALTLTYRVNANNTVKYIASRRRLDSSDQVDLDSTPSFIYQYATVSKFGTDSNELQWVGKSGDLTYTTGLYSYKEDYQNYNPQSSGGTTNFANDVSGSTKASAIFGQLDYKFSDNWAGSLGLRRSTDEKSVDSSQYGTGTSFNGAITPAGLSAFIRGAAGLIPVTTNLGDVLLAGAPLNLSKQATGATTVAYPSAFHAMGNASFSATTPAASVTYKFDEGFSTYARIAKGFRSGGFPATAGGASTAQVIAARTSVFNPEQSTTKELGFKSSFWGGKAQVNGAVYQNVVDNQQTTQLVPGTTSTIIVNAGRVKYKGFEIEGTFAVASGWRVGGSWGYSDANFDKYIDNGRNNGGTLIDTASNRVVGYAPKNTFNLNVDGRLAQTSWGTLRGVMDINHVDQMYNMAANKSLTAANAANITTVEYALIPSRTMVNARLILAGLQVGGPGVADLSIWARNLTDTRKVINNIDFGTYRTLLWTDPRMVGVSFNYKW